MSKRQTEFILELRRAGCSLKRYGSKHDVYENESTGKQATIPKAPVLADSLVKEIRKQLGLN
jgi:HicA toxin of bacterial toxin-antitoxin,